MAFDWQSELVSTVKPPPPSTVAALSTNCNPPKKSFAQALVAATVTDTSPPLPTPVIRGETLCIPISDETYEQGIDACKRNLRDRLILSKGDKPYGFREDMRSVWSKGTQNLKPGLLRLFEWFKDFTARTQRQTHAQVWIRLLELPQEYWMDRMLKEIASAIGTPLLIDSATQNRVFGHYARVLVDMDLSKHIFNEVMIERTGFSFSIEITYERLPAFVLTAGTLDIISQKPQPPKWQPKDNLDGIGSSKAFEAPVGNNDVEDIPTPHEVATDLPVQTDITVSADAQHSDPQNVNVSAAIQHSDDDVIQSAAAHHSDDVSPQNVTKGQHDFEFIPYLHDDIRKDTLPSTTIHVLEEISDSAEAQEEDITAAAEPLFTDVMELEAQTQTHSTYVELFTEEANNVPARVAPLQHHDETQTHVLSPVKQMTLDISSIVAPEGSKIDPVLQKDLDFMHTWLSKAAATEVPFIEVVSKSQKKKNMQKIPYKTRSQGPLPPSK
ncbi:DUF4283 domain protein [Medicago truncatula]|uniref:DUF4283 domain protein n=1 Tax=Medicago truncatula TaxID=3880 RepID=A0A072UAN6_MEDTR|nr:DUF4283 domain protein [Medicago truncatula]